MPKAVTFEVFSEAGALGSLQPPPFLVLSSKQLPSHMIFCSHTCISMPSLKCLLPKCPLFSRLPLGLNFLTSCFNKTSSLERGPPLCLGKTSQPLLWVLSKDDHLWFSLNAETAPYKQAGARVIWLPIFLACCNKSEFSALGVT